MANDQKKQNYGQKYLVDSKWVFNKNKYDILRSHLVAQRYTKNPEVDFTKNYTTVFSDVTMQVILLMWLINKCYSQLIYVDTTFIYTTLEEGIDINTPMRKTDALRK